MQFDRVCHDLLIGLKGTMGIVSLYSANYSEESWGDPMVFRPERFLDEKTNTLDPDVVAKVMAFGLGMTFFFFQGWIWITLSKLF